MMVRREPACEPRPGPNRKFWHVCTAVAVCIGLCMGHASAQTLTVGRSAVGSTLVDIGVRVMTEAARRADITLEFRPLPLIRALTLANEGSIDADLMHTRETAQAYPNLIALNTPIAHFDAAAYGTSPDITRLARDDFHRLRIGAARGLGLAKRTPDIPITEVATDGALPQMLDNGRFDVVIASYLYTETWRKNKRGIYRWPKCWSTDPVVFSLNRKHQAIASRLDTALAQMQREGVIDRIYNEALDAAGISPLDCGAENR